MKDECEKRDPVLRTPCIFDVHLFENDWYAMRAEDEGARAAFCRASALFSALQPRLFRARRCSLFPLGAEEPVLEQMAHRRDRSFGARTVVGPKIALTRMGEEEHA